jgi:hypothetical protein
MSRQALVPGRHAVSEGEEPGAQRPVRLVTIELLVNENENLVGHVLEITSVDAEAPEREPDVVELALENGVKVRGLEDLGG